jgi:heterodisulfide reductase subunit B
VFVRLSRDCVPIREGMTGTDKTLSGLSTKKSWLERFSHVDWLDVQPATGRDADRVVQVCPRCAAAMGRRRDTKPWRRSNPRP